LAADGQGGKMAIKDINKCIDEAVDCIVGCGDINRRLCIRLCVKDAIGCVLIGRRRDLLVELAKLDKEIAALTAKKRKKR
jgi:hypothetical protein